MQFSSNGKDSIVLKERMEKLDKNGFTTIKA